MNKMKAEELRIGNYVQLGTQWFEVDAKNILEFQEDGSCMPYGPLPITEEWLNKLGCIKCIGGGYEWHQLTPNGWLSIHFLQGGFYPRVRKEELNEIQYVHQLQNLYFALTGTELTIKP